MPFAIRLVRPSIPYPWEVRFFRIIKGLVAGALSNGNGQRKACVQLAVDKAGRSIASQAVRVSRCALPFSCFLLPERLHSSPLSLALGTEG